MPPRAGTFGQFQPERTPRRALFNKMPGPRQAPHLGLDPKNRAGVSGLECLTRRRYQHADIMSLQRGREAGRVLHQRGEGGIVAGDDGLDREEAANRERGGLGPMVKRSPMEQRRYPAGVSRTTGPYPRICRYHQVPYYRLARRLHNQAIGISKISRIRAPAPEE